MRLEAIIVTDPPMSAAPDAPSSKRRFVHRLFTTIAPRYDQFNRLASLTLDRRWRRRVVAEGRVEPGMRVLDVCTGTGDLALLCADRVAGEGLVVGADFNAMMLRGAAVKSAAVPRPPAWLRGDAQALPFPAGVFDRVLIGFSTRNLSDLPGGLREMIRVLKPGGQLLVLETGRPSHPVVRAGYFVFLHTVARAVGWVLTGRVWPFSYLARSVKEFLSPPEVVALLQRCGAAARYVPLSKGLASLYVADKPSA